MLLEKMRGYHFRNESWESISSVMKKKIRFMSKQNGFIVLFRSIRQVKRIIVFVVGMTVVLIGIAMIVLPGPGMVVIPLGLLILATEFVWAKKLLERVRQRINRWNSHEKGKG